MQNELKFENSSFLAFIKLFLDFCPIIGWFSPATKLMDCTVRSNQIHFLRSYAAEKNVNLSNQILCIFVPQLADKLPNVKV